MPASKKVLVVEDDSELSSFMEKALKSENYEVATAWSGEKALLEAKQRPDLILLDISIEGIHGLQVLAELRKDPKTKDIPVVICSSVAGDKHKEKARNLGADGSITKPFHMDDFTKLIHRMIG